MRVLGIDPGTFKMGAGVVDSEEGEISLVYVGVLSASRADPLSQRLHRLYQQLMGVIEEWRPSEVAMENPFVSRNVRAAMAIGQAQSVAMVVAAHHGLPVSGYSPPEVKRAVTDYGASSKGQVQERVGALLGLEQPPRPSDAADALAVAICHINASQVHELATID